ncbi:hypothetical protein FO519_001140 [Halicephalobus sp. NKZ332]|nr:hypothetical protein FO519_001140 [Halicephalobus sp. NKZ332]
MLLMESRITLIAAHSSNPNSFRLNESALSAVFGHREIANKKVFFTGAFRKGKSFLLNFFLEYLYALQNSQQNDIQLDWLGDDVQLQGFHWRSGAKRDTTGIWLWGEPIMIEAASGEKYAVILMDTQGTFDGTSATRHGLSIFGLSSLLSSHQCYNLIENIPPESLQQLSLLVEYGKLFLAEAQDFGKPFQSLSFVVRDFKSPDDFPYGAEGGTKFLEQALEISAGETEVMRMVKRELKEVFEHVNSFLLPHPGHKVAERNSFKGYVKDIRPVFREEVKRMTHGILNPHVIQPKLINGKEVTCKKMMEYIREFVRVFDSTHECPSPRNILNANAQILCIESAVEAKTAYCRGMDRVTSGPRMMSEKKLLEAHIKHGITALNIYDKCLKVGDGEVRSANLARLQEDINAELDKYKRLNEDKRVTGCASALLACGDSVFFGLGLGGAASGAVAASVVTLQLGVVSAGIVAIPISLTALFGIWCYVTVKPLCQRCRKKKKK